MLFYLKYEKHNSMMELLSFVSFQTALLVVFAAHADTYFYSKSLDADEGQHEQLAALFDLHMIEATQNNPYQLNVDACLKDGKKSLF
jgi:hypothetical protein